MALIDKLTVIADAIRGKTGKTEKMTLDQMAAEIAGIENGGGDLDLYITRNITEINSPVETVGNSAFQGCEKLTAAIFPNAKSIADYAFRYCSALNTVDIPQAESIGSYAFNECNSLESVNFPGALVINSSAFFSCAALEKAVFPKAETLKNYVFNNCRKLKTVEFYKTTSIGGSSFINCHSLTTLIIRSNTLCTAAGGILGGCYHFDGTVNATYNPNGLKDGYIYVPSALLEAYKTATNWSVYADQFRPIEGSDFE